MIRSRPGFSPITTPDTGPKVPVAPIATLNKDMIPALNRRDQPATSASGMTVKVGAAAPAPAEVPPEVARVAPEIIANTHESPAPLLTTPHKD